MTARIIETPELFRSNIKSNLAKLVEIDDQSEIAINLEKGIYNYAIKEATSRKIVKKWDNTQFVQLYIDRLRSVYLNLSNKEKCADLILGIKSGEIAAQTVAFMTHQEFAPQHWRTLIEKKIKRDASRFTTNIEASTDMFTCKKCRSKRCTYYELQTRSADEPATIFITCLDCGKNWKN
jgi:transcription elongation factor S-II